MVMKIVAGSYTRSDMFNVAPSEILLNNDLRGRQFAPEEDKIIALAESMIDYGQQQPVQARRNSDNRLLLVMGFTRTAAARLIVDGFTGSDGLFRQDSEFKLQVKITNGNDEDSLIRNIVENAIRNECSPIDDAHNQERLRDRHGKSDIEIAKVYGYSSGVKVGRLRKLLSLCADGQKLVHIGKLGVQGAIDLLDLPADKQKEIIAGLMNDETIKGSDIRAVVREHHLADSEVVLSGGNVGELDEVTPPVKGAKPLSVREMRKYLTELQEDEKTADEIKGFAKVMLAFVNGTKSEKQMTNAMKKLLAVDPNAVVEVVG